jgi:hypothetical protein
MQQICDGHHQKSLASEHEVVQHWVMKTMQWSEAARTPREVAAAVESTGQVRLERRGEVPFVITREDRVRQARDAMEVAARFIRNIFTQGRSGDPIFALLEALPWAQFLPEKDRSQFARELVWTFQACSDLDLWAPFGQMLHEWQQTAAIHAEPDLAKELGRSLDADLGLVEMPVPEEESGAEEG